MKTCGVDVRLWVNTSAVTPFLPGQVSSFVGTHPGIRIEPEEEDSQEIVLAVLHGRADLGIFCRPRPRPRTGRMAAATVALPRGDVRVDEAAASMLAANPAVIVLGASGRSRLPPAGDAVVRAPGRLSGRARAGGRAAPVTGDGGETLVRALESIDALDLSEKMRIRFGPGHRDPLRRSLGPGQLQRRVDGVRVDAARDHDHVRLVAIEQWHHDAGHRMQTGVVAATREGCRPPIDLRDPRR